MPHVASSAVTDIDYDPKGGRLIVRFRSGERYAYAPASRELYHAFLNAPSKGRFFQAQVKDAIAYSRL